MKDRTKRIKVLKLEIEEIEKDIRRADRLGKHAFATRLRLIHEKKETILKSWIINS
tara:strand:- start:1174 stop:1341 length:168 start_codon:yes stop_codon:yes gene_type:complete